MEPETLRLGIDLDGVVADFHAGWVRRYCEDFDARIRPDEVVGWDSLTELTHFDDDDAFWRWARGCDPGIFRHLPVIDGAAETLRALAADHRIVVITAKVAWAVPDTLAWLADHRLPVTDVHFTFEKQEVACDVYLDDSPHHLVSILEEHPGSTVCRMVRPWNEPVDGAVDVHGWGEFEAIVDEIAAGGGSARVGQSARIGQSGGDGEAVGGGESASGGGSARVGQAASGGEAANSGGPAGRGESTGDGRIEVGRGSRVRQT